MKRAVDSIDALITHPAPGVIFAEHKGAMLPRRAHATRHERRAPMSAIERRELDALIAGNPELTDLAEVYQRFNGCNLFYLKCPNCDDPHWAISLLPVSAWAAATARWQAGGECESFMEGCDLYTLGTWRVIANIASEGMNLVQFFSGEHDGKRLAGRIFCLGLDGYLGFQEEVAPNLSALFDDVTRNPAAFFDRVGFTWVIDADAGAFGDPIHGYSADIRGDPDLQPWPLTRPLR